MAEIRRCVRVKPLLHISMDFEAREDVRTLARRLAEAGHERPGDYAALYALRLWCDFARSGTDWRALSCSGQPNWENENIAFLIEDYCLWKGKRGRLVDLFLASDMLRVVQREDLQGLTLRDYAGYNEHLLPDYKSQQSKGGFAKAQAQRARQIEALAEQQAHLFQKQGDLIFAPEVTAEEQKRAVALVMRLDIACGRSIRGSREYTQSKTLLGDALALVRRLSSADIDLVQRYLVANRTNPAVVKDPELIIRDFDGVLRKAKAE